MQKISRTVGPGVYELYHRWAEQYRACCRKTMPFTNVSCNEIFIEDQIEFIRLYLGFILADGPDQKETVERVDRFLSMQKAIPDENMIGMHFVGGAPVEVIVNVETLNDVDVADIHGLVEFDIMFAYRAEGKRWTRKNTGSFIRDLRDDLEYDGCKVDLEYSYGRNQLIIECTIE